MVEKRYTLFFILLSLRLDGMKICTYGRCCCDVFGLYSSLTLYYPCYRSGQPLSPARPSCIHW